jgi:lysophospholipase L1-like esterase
LPLYLNIKSISPQSSILITTAADNYKNKLPGNREIRDINNFIIGYCDARGIPYWDLYKTTGGFSSAKKWNKSQYMSKDRIHFTSQGYILQANLLYNAFAKSFNNYSNRNQN